MLEIKKHNIIGIRLLAAFFILCGILFLIKSANAIYQSSSIGVQIPIKTVAGGDTQIASDNFEGFTPPAALNTANWSDEVNGFNSATDVADIVAVGTSGGGYNVTYWSNDSFAADQYSQCTLQTLGAATYIGPTARVTGTGSFYVLHSDDNELYLEACLTDGSDCVTVASDTSTWAPSAGWKLRLEVTGADTNVRLTAKYDSGGGWVTKFSSQDPGVGYRWNSGYAGIGGYAYGNYIDDWSGGNL